MFKAVGEKYPNPKLTNQKDWYSKRTWTQKQESEFKEWMKRKLQKEYGYWSKKMINNEIQWFLLMWGWKVRKR